MKIAVIASASYLEAFCKGRPLHLALTHKVLEDEAYLDFYRNEQDSYTVLDNSLIELGSSVSLEAIVSAANYIEANEIVLPDVFRCGEATVEAVVDALHEIEQMGLLGKFKLAAVAQGSNPEEWLNCYAALCTFKHLDVIHIPKVCDTFWYGGRYGLLTHLDAYMEHTRHSPTATYMPPKEHHLLGVWSNPIEIAYAQRFNWIRSLDTALPIHTGKTGRMFHPNFGLNGTSKSKRPPDFFEWDHMLLDEAQQYAIKHNIATLDQFASGEDYFVNSKGHKL